MKHKIKKEYIKTNLIGFIIAGIIISGVVVYAAVTFPSNEISYSNTESGLNSNNVQGAIDELYKDCKGIITAGGKDFETVTSGDGLYKDEYEDRYFYRGQSVNNYITFNNETWRILSIENDGTIKIMKNESIGQRNWNYSDLNSWTRPASINTYLNEAYYNSLTSTAQSQIVSHDWSIGSVGLYEPSLTNLIDDENSRKWNGKVALPTVSEFVRSNSNQNDCGSPDAIFDNRSCVHTVWMHNPNYIQSWTLSANSASNGSVAYVMGIYYYGLTRLTASYDDAHTRPVVYLSSEIKITGGNGSSSSPYTLG